MRSSRNCHIRQRGRKARLRGEPRIVPPELEGSPEDAGRWLRGWDGVGRGTFGIPVQERQFSPKACVSCGVEFTPTAPHNIYCPSCKPKRKK